MAAKLAYLARRTSSSSSSRQLLLISKFLSSSSSSDDPFRPPATGPGSLLAAQRAPIRRPSPPIRLPPLVPPNLDHRHVPAFRIELVDSPLWSLSSDASNSSWSFPGSDPQSEASALDEEDDESSLDFEAIDEMRLQKRLFYKLDKGSKEFEENNFSFFRKKSERSDDKKKKKKKKEAALDKISKLESKKVEKKPQNAKSLKPKKASKAPGKGNEGSFTDLAIVEEKKAKRMPTFNQLTDPYHLPFCLDIFVTKGSVRASIVHRVTSKVVTVAHSISKDMKFDLKSRKDSAACGAVGRVLAQRAVEDDIHNLVYTPRTGEKIEGKIQVVLQSIIDNGVDVKVKLKQKRNVKKITVPQEDEACMS